MNKLGIGSNNRHDDILKNQRTHDFRDKNMLFKKYPVSMLTLSSIRFSII